MKSVSFYRPGNLVQCLLLFCTFLMFPSGLFSAGFVTLKSIEIFTTHEIFSQPSVYFQCKGENRTFLPDVKRAHQLYAFKGEESWQPLTELPDKKCKRCGLYERDTFKSDDVFDEWEMCPDDFKAPDGKYIRFMAKEFNASFLFPKCLLEHDIQRTHPSLSIESKNEIVASCTIGVILSLYRYWQNRKRQQDQARFLKLFEQDDDIDVELGLGNEI